MKKTAFCLMLAALIFSCVMTGFYIGRGTGTEPVIVSRTQPATASADTTGVQPSETEPQATATDPGTQPSTQETEPVWPVNINTATLEQLQTLPGIGPVLAQRILDYREENGPFLSVSELTMVSGIGISTLEKLLDYVTVGGES